MIQEQIIQILRNNEQLAAIPIEPFSVEAGKNSIVYTFTPLTDNNLVRTDKLEIHIIANNLLDAFAIDMEVRKTLLTTGDTPLANGIQQVEINGGGTLEDTATGTIHAITYYYIVSNGGIKNELK